MYIRKELRRYIDDLASLNAAPGGGSASALVGAVGVALNTMVANFTLRSERYKKVHSRVKLLYRNNELIRKKLEVLIDKDVVVFLKLKDIMSMSKENIQRNVLLEKCFKDAADIPFEICLAISQAAKMCFEIAKIGNVNLISDIGSAMYLLEAAYNSACLNVKINLKYIKDKKFIKKKKQDLGMMKEKISKVKKTVMKKVRGYL